MSEYRVRETGEVLSQGQVRKLNPSVSLPRVWNANVCDFLGVDPVTSSPKPDATSVLKIVVRNGVEQDAKGNWVYAWVEQDKFSDTVEDGVTVTKSEHEKKYQDLLDANEEKNVRLKRDIALSNTDWTVLQDSPLTDAQVADWVIYRQALRDITDHANFPYLEDADWPVKPE